MMLKCETRILYVGSSNVHFQRQGPHVCALMDPALPLLNGHFALAQMHGCEDVQIIFQNKAKVIISAGSPYSSACLELFFFPAPLLHTSIL